MSRRAPHPARFGGIGLWLQPPEEGRHVEAGGLLEVAAAAVGEAERAGIGSVWVSESPVPGGAATPYEAYSLLGALAVRSDRVRLGAVAVGAERRAPSILAKIVTGVDVISHGRAVLALDGDCTTQADGERLSEALTVSRAVLVDEHPTYSGRIYAIDDAVNRPAPVQVGGVPIVVFVHGEGPARAALLGEAARLADAVAVDGGPDGVRAARDAVESRPDDGHGRAEVLGRLVAGPAGDDLVDGVAAIRSAGATGCLVGLAHPWDALVVGGLASAW